MEERATKAQGTRMLSFERYHSRSMSRMGHEKDVLWVVPEETELPPKKISIAISNYTLDTEMFRELVRFGHTKDHTCIFIPTLQRQLNRVVFG